jgi:hypothetical protein
LLQGESRKMGALLAQLGTFMAMAFDRKLAGSLRLNMHKLELDLVRGGLSKNQASTCITFSCVC